jgi:protein SCO1/2
VTQALGYRYTWIPATGQYAHMAAIAVLAPDGRLVRWLPGLGVAPTALAAALADARRGRTDDLGGAIRLLCFHFDPTTGRYTLAIFRLTQILAGGFAALVAAAVGLAFWRERRRGTPGGAAG